MGKDNKLAQFEETILPHVRAAYNLARWLTGSEHDAEDVAQEAYLRAFKFFEGFRGIDSRAWLLAIVRNTCYTWLKQKKMHDSMTVFDEENHSTEENVLNPETKLLQAMDTELIRKAIEELPVEYREVVVLCDLEGLSYKEIAQIIKLPIGTVMSRIARARKRLIELLCGVVDGEF
ncbi:MAG: sigma-70 family RNA polymerase sigma factor [Thermodesulfobacteriota bacterium]